MDIREKVITGLKCKLKEDGKIGCADCPYDKDFNCIGCDAMLHDVLTLLKAQEPIKPLKMEVDHVRRGPIVFSYQCPVCTTGLQRHWVACPSCGRAVKWDG